MIARIWRGWTTPHNADEYERRLHATILPDIAARNIPGYRGVHVLRRALAAEVEFTTIMWFDSLDDVRAFVPGDFQRAHVPDIARELLSRFDERSAHHEVRQTPNA